MNESIKTNKTNMTKIINNLTGSNMGLNINELANKCAERDKIIHESINSNDSDFIKHTHLKKISSFSIRVMQKYKDSTIAL